MSTRHDPERPPSAGGTGRAAGGGEEERVRLVLERRAQCLWEKDASALAALYGAGVVTFDLAPPLAQAGAAVTGTSGWQGWFDTWESPIGLEITELAVDVEGSLAVCHSLNRMRGTKTDGAIVDLWFRATVALRRVAGVWVIVHEHNSVPFLMDGSGLAALELRP
jgi:PhnB protein